MRRAAGRLLPLLLCAAAGCGDSGPAAPPAPEAGAAWQGSLSPRPTADAVVVAAVNGDPIWDVDVARYAGARGLTPAEALDELIGLQLLAQEAMRRGLADDPEVADARKRAQARALLRVAFEPEWTGAESVPDSDVDAAWARKDIYTKFNHYEYHDAAFFRVPVKKGSPPTEGIEACRKAKLVREAVVARRPEDVQAFLDAALEEAARLDIRVQANKPFATTEHHGPGHESFARLAFSIDEVGEISEPGLTPWGCDTLFLARIVPELFMSKQQAAPEIRRNLFESSRRLGFLKWADQLAGKHQVATHPELLDRVAVEAPALELEPGPR